MKLNKDNYGTYGQVLSTVGGVSSGMTTRPNGRTSVGGKAISSGLSLAGTGMAFGPIGAAVGFGLGATIGSISAARTNKRMQEEEEELRRKGIEDRNMMYSDYSKQIYNTYPSQGVQGAMMYGAYGGRILAGGGMLNVGNTAKVVVGDKHGMDTDGDGRNGVPVMDANGNQQAEVEGGEIMYTDAMGNQKVLSAKLGVADAAKKVMQTPEYQKAEIMFQKKVDNINKQMSTAKNDKFMINTLNERLRGIKHPLDDLYAQQEQIKQSQGIPENQTAPQPQTMAYGGTIDNPLRKTPKNPLQSTMLGIDDNAIDFNKTIDIVPDSQTSMKTSTFTPNYETPVYSSNRVTSIPARPITPDTNTTSTDVKPIKSNNNLKTLNTIGAGVSFADNIYNSWINSNRPPVPSPVLGRALPLNTKVNVSPILESNRKQLNYLMKNIDNTTDNSQVARANKIAGFAANINQTNNVMMDKINKETQLENQATLNQQGVINTNANILNNNNMTRMLAKDDILMSNSENVANAVSKATMLIRQENLKDLDKQKLAIILQKYKNTGVLTRTENDYINQLIEMGK